MSLFTSLTSFQMNSLNVVLLQAGGTDPGMFNLIFFVGILVVFYFVLIRPQQKRQKEEKLFRDSMEKGDRVITLGGIYGTVVSIDEATVIIKVDDNVKIKVDKSALRAAPDATPKAEKQTT